MPYGYLGTKADQTIENFGVFSINDVADLVKQGKLGGSLKLIEEQTVTGSVSAVDFINLPSNYEVLLLQVNGLNADSSKNPRIQFSNNNGSSFIASGYKQAHKYLQADGSYSEQRSSSRSDIALDLTISTTTKTSHLYIYLYNFSKSSEYSYINIHSIANASNNIVGSIWGGGVLPTAEVHNAIRILISSGDISGNFKLFGVKEI